MSHPVSSPESRRQQMADAFYAQYQQQPEVGVRAPGRVDLMGSHTDYNEGSVLTLPIDRDTWILARANDQRLAELHSLNLDSSCSFSLDGSEPVSGWGRYVQAVLEQLRAADCPLIGFQAVVHGTVPIGSGLSSSASLEAATATLAEQIGKFSLGKLEKASLCQRAENEGVGVNCGILDQYSSILGEAGRAIQLDCRSLTHETAPLSDELTPVICDTRAPRQLTGSEYGARRRQCEEAAAFFASLDRRYRTLRDVPADVFEDHQQDLSPDVRKRARFIIEEQARVGQLAEALAADDRRAIGTLMADSFTGARDLFEISVSQMQAMFDAMRVAPGVVGCRQAGAGFGGCMIALVDSEHTLTFVDAVQHAYQAATDIEPEIYAVRASAGAGALDEFGSDADH